MVMNFDLFQQDLERCMPHSADKRVMELALQYRVYQVPPDLCQWATDLTPPFPLSRGGGKPQSRSEIVQDLLPSQVFPVQQTYV